MQDAAALRVDAVLHAEVGEDVGFVPVGGAVSARVDLILESRVFFCCLIPSPAYIRHALICFNSSRVAR